MEERGAAKRAGLEKFMVIGGVRTKNNVFLAPMAGVTDLAFRIVAREHGAGLCYSEMISAKGLSYNNGNTRALLVHDNEPGPIAVQIFGSEPDIMAETARRLCEETDFDIIDINMGCPAAKIVKNGEGSAIMRRPELAGRIIKAVAAASSVPVTVKIRKGFNDSEINAAEIAKIAEESGAAAITVHGRTREQQYAGAADWGIIADVKRAVSIPVIANGDIKSAADAIACLRRTGADAVMIGRAACGDPWLFGRCAAALAGSDIPPEPSIKIKMLTAARHFALLLAEKGEYTAAREFRAQLSHYIKGLSGAAAIRREIMSAESAASMQIMIEKIAALAPE